MAASLTGDVLLFARQRRVVILMIAAMGLVLVASTLWKRYFLSTNPASRIITVERLLEAGTFAHLSPTDTTPFELSIDAIKVGESIYSSKPPNYPLVMTAESWVMKKLTGWEFYAHRRDYVRMLTIANQVIPYLLMLYVFFLFLREFTQDSWTLYFLVLAIGAGSLPFAYASTINNHTVSAFLFMFSWYWVYRLTTQVHGKWWQYLLLGVMLGFAVSTELPGAAYAAVFMVLLLVHDWKMTLWAVLGGLLPFIPMMIVFKLISGSWKPFYFQGDLYRYEGSYWANPEGLDAIKESKGRYLLNIVFGYKGLFFMTPVLVLGVIGWVRMLMRRGKGIWWHWVALAVASMAVFLFVWLRTYNYGGDCIGLRWMIVAIPFLTFASWPVVEQLGRSWPGRILCIVLLLWGMPGVAEALIHDAFIKGPWQEMWGAIFRGG